MAAPLPPITLVVPVGGRGGSWFGPGAVYQRVRPLVHFAVRVFVGFDPRRVTRFRLFLDCGVTMHGPNFFLTLLWRTP